MFDEVKTVIRDHWNARAADYDGCAHHAIALEAERAEWARLFTAWIGAAPKTILDVGTGTGEIALLLAALGHEVTGVDIAEDMLEQARAKAAARGLNVTFLSADAEDPPFPAAAFDAVVNRHLLWTLPNPERALVAWARVLAPGGKMAIVDGDFHCAAKPSAAGERASPSLDAYRAGGILDRLPMQADARPQADLKMLATLGLRAEARLLGPGGDFFVDLPFGARADNCRFALFVEKPL